MNQKSMVEALAQDLTTLKMSELINDFVVFKFMVLTATGKTGLPNLLLGEWKQHIEHLEQEIDRRCAQMNPVPNT